MSTKTQRAHWCAIVLQACSYWLYLEDMCYWWDHKHLCIIDFLMCNKERWLKRSRWPLTLKLKIMVSQYNSPKLEVPFFILFWSPLPHSLMKTTSTRLLMIANDGRCQSHHSGILLSAHLHPKGMVFFHRSLSDHCMTVRETRWGGGHQHSQRWITSAHSPQGLAYLLTQLCTHMLEKKKKRSASPWTFCLFFCSIWQYLCLELRTVPVTSASSILQLLLHFVVDLLVAKLELQSL